MKLTMRIENFDALDDGGPLEFAIDGDGFEAGRDSAMDWTLPDPSRHISSRHFEVTYRGGAYFITDCSTNGTYRVGETNRISSPLQLYGGERFQVGQYVIAVALGDGAPARAPAPAGAGFGGGYDSGFGGGGADPWSMGGGGPAPIPVNDLIPERQRRTNFDDEFIATPQSRSPSGVPGGFGAQSLPPRPGPVPGGLGAPSAPRPAAPAAAPPMPASPGFGPSAGSPSLGFPSTPPAAPNAPAGYAPAPQSVATGDLGAFLAALCQSAGLPADSFAGADPGQLAGELGQALRIATEGVMMLLAARAQAKTFVKSASRTMIGATDNNPMKFLPDPGQALDAMFFHKRAGFMDGVAGFADAFGDIKTHQASVYAAIQPALAGLLEDLSPDAIEAKAGSKGGIMGAKKAAMWDIYVDRWDAKTMHHDNGMLDVFLAIFAEAYDRATRESGKS